MVNYPRTLAFSQYAGHHLAFKKCIQWWRWATKLRQIKRLAFLACENFIYVTQNVRIINFVLECSWILTSLAMLCAWQCCSIHPKWVLTRQFITFPFRNNFNNFNEVYLYIMNIFIWDVWAEIMIIITYLYPLK